MSAANTASDLDVYRGVPQVLRAQQAKIDELTAKVAEYEMRKEAEEVVAMMDRKGLSDPDASWADKVQAVLGSETPLPVIKQAAELSNANFGFSRVSETDDAHGNTDAFENFIQTGES